VPVLILFACILVACAPNPGSVVTDPIRTGSPRPTKDLGTYFDHAPDFPGYAWTYKGQGVDTTHGMNTIAGPAHCDWQAATFMHLPWPLGTDPTDASNVRQYIRDPKRVMPQGNLHGTLDLHATLPADAVATGYRYQAIEVFVSPSDQDDAVYVVGPGAVERWQRSDPITLCA
jgi:hypothetical protein